MTLDVIDLPKDVATALQNDLLAIADTKLVLGNWYTECVMNGRSLPDFAAILGMCTASFGQTRALYQYLTQFGHDFAHLERGRGAGEICSMNLLDEAPAGWEDFLAATWLAELASWMMLSGFLHNPDRQLAGLAKKIGQESYFHLKYADGWMRIIAEGKDATATFRKMFDKRYPLALQWFGAEGAADPVHAAGRRDMSMDQVRGAFVKEVAKAGDILGANLPTDAKISFGKDWRADARRNGPLPAGLWEVVRFKDQELAW
jgi:ring-1,2-phenylacetyl-CoA epoxidase subunit PaaC